ncbi:MAG: hypothetical protein ACR2K2_01735 [Mycobacteriales bacterium]
MPITTIKVERAVRDRLAEMARGRGVSMGALLDVESRRLEADKHWSDVVASHERLCTDDPAGWAGYLSALVSWAAGTAGHDSGAADEWPEYNLL